MRLERYKYLIMKKTLIFGAFAAFILMSASCCRKTEPDNQNQLLLATAWYQQSAEMRACYYQAYHMAQLALDNNLNSYKGEKRPAVVLDIDETVLDNSPFEAGLIAANQSYSDSLWKVWTDRAEAAALPGAAEFISHARQKGVDVFFISNRRDEERATTLQNLAAAGMPTDSAYLLTIAPGESSCKDSRREKVSETHEILLFVGDNMGDYSSLFDRRNASLALGLADSLQNDFGTRFIVLPNPMYGEWENAIYRAKGAKSRNDKNKTILERLKL